MNLPFSHDAFLDVFGAYNAAMWPAVVLLWLVTAALFAHWIRSGRITARSLFGLLAVHWAWSGIVYHWLFFRPINPAATLFGALFVVQAGIFVWFAARERGLFDVGRNARTILGWALVSYGLVYPFVGLVGGLRYPRLPLFAIPCPTTLVTAGLLLISARVPRLVYVVPILWAATGGSAAFVLGIRADLALPVAGALLVIDAIAPSVLGARATRTPGTL